MKLHLLGGVVVPLSPFRPFISAALDSGFSFSFSSLLPKNICEIIHQYLTDLV